MGDPVKGDSLGDRMKGQYEHRTRYFLPRRTYTIIRVDGKAFHGYTAHLERPFDAAFMADMNSTALAMCEQMQGAALAYVQSDEISVLLTDFAKPTTAAWFDGNLQKMASIAAAMATAEFNATRRATGQYRALFDARVFTIPDPVEVENYFIWRQQDATRNSIQMAAQALYSQKQLHGKNTSDMQELLHAKGVNWNDYSAGCKRGRAIVKRDLGWDVEEPPVFTADRAYLRARIPIPWADPSGPSRIGSLSGSQATG